MKKKICKANLCPNLIITKQKENYGMIFLIKKLQNSDEMQQIQLNNKF